VYGGLVPALDTPDPRTLLGGERQVLELIATGAPLESVLDALCRVIDEQSGLRSSIFLLDGTGGWLSLAAGPHLSDPWKQAVASVPVTATSCGAAVTLRKQTLAPDIASDPSFQGFHDALRQAGVRAAWSTPFFSMDGRPLGTFAVYSETVGPPSAINLALVERATHLASIAVERDQTERGLRESERRFSIAFYSSPGAFSITGAEDGRFRYINDQFVTLFGYSRAETIGRTSLALGMLSDPAQRAVLLTLLDEHKVHDVEVKVRTKSGDTLDVLLWMERIQILGENCVLTVSCDITERKRTEEALAQSERLLKVVLDALPVGLTLVNAASDIVLTNPASRRIWGDTIRSGRERYARSKGWWHDTGRMVQQEEWASTHALSKGETVINQLVDIETFDAARKTIENSAVPIRDANGRITGAVIVNDDVTARVSAEQKLHDSLVQMRTLSGRLMRAQDDERRRIARELHETTAQDLAGLKMLLARLNRTSGQLSDADRAILDESVQLADRTMSEIRTLAYLLHPPFLDEVGLLSALRWYAQGFAERSGIEVTLDLPEVLQRLHQDVETMLFRVVQEALINIHRHAGSPDARIRLRVVDGRLSLEIEDHGKGMTPEFVGRLRTGTGAIGVGLAGMRERLEQLGGAFDIDSGDHGTTVRATVPIRAAAP
jgi:PAS domain S-box-containing protein